jgi:purine nucleosidase
MKLRTLLCQGIAVLASLAVGVPAGSAAAASVPRSGSIPAVIYDSDMDFDDVSTLAYLCQEHKQGRIALKAVTINNDGMGVPGRSVTHARTVLRGCGLPGVPVATGSGTGVHPPPPEVQEIVEGILTDSLGDGAQQATPSAVPAATLIARVVRGARSPVMVLTTGPLSNVAEALRRGGPSPTAAGIHRLYVMGGALDVPGNLFGSTVSGFDNTQEFNMWLDPPAADRVFASVPHARVRLVSLDASDNVPVTEEYAGRLAADARTYEARLVSTIVTHPDVALLREIGALYWWDPLAALSMVRGGTVVGYKVRNLDVVLDGPSSGRTIDSPQGTPQYAGSTADLALFEETFLSALNGA